MENHKDAIKYLRLRIKTLAQEKLKLRTEIRALAFDPEGKRRPETGDIRHGMKRTYNEGTRPDIRSSLLAYGILRGVPYARMEASASPDKYGYRWLLSSILSEIHQAMDDNAELKSLWTDNRVHSIIRDGQDPVAQEAA